MTAEENKYKVAFEAMCKAAGFNTPHSGPLEWDAEVKERCDILKENSAYYKKRSQDFFNLLARIHKDGGQYVDMVGEEQALADADKIICDYHSREEEQDSTRLLRKLVDELNEEVKELRSEAMEDDKIFSQLRAIFAPADADPEVSFNTGWVKKVKEYRNEASRCRTIAQILCEKLQVHAALAGVWRVPGETMNIEMFICSPTLNEANLGPAAKMIIDGIWKQEEDGKGATLGDLRVTGTMAEEEE